MKRVISMASCLAVVATATPAGSVAQVREIGAVKPLAALLKARRICLRTFNGRNFLQVLPSGEVRASGRGCGPWEAFDLMDRNGGQVRAGDPVSLRAHTGHFVRAHPNGEVDTAASAQQSETFVIYGAGRARAEIRVGDIALLRSFHNRYLVAEGGGGHLVRANRPRAETWERFVVVDAAGVQPLRAMEVRAPVYRPQTIRGDLPAPVPRPATIRGEMVRGDLPTPIPRPATIRGTMVRGDLPTPIPRPAMIRGEMVRGDLPVPLPHPAMKRGTMVRGDLPVPLPHPAMKRGETVRGDLPTPIPRPATSRGTMVRGNLPVPIPNPTGRGTMVRGALPTPPPRAGLMLRGAMPTPPPRRFKTRKSDQQRVNPVSIRSLKLRTLPGRRFSNPQR